MLCRLPSNPPRGFTLVELVVVIVIMGILAYVGANLIGNFMGHYLEASKRQELASAGRIGVERMTREIRRALPNSVWTQNGGDRITFLRTFAGGRYQAVGRPSSRLTTYPGDDPANNEIFTAYGLSGLDSQDHLTVYPVEREPLYDDDLAVTESGPRARIADDGGSVGYGSRRIELDANDDFAHQSPQRRIQAIDAMVTFCYVGDPENAVFMNVQDLGPDLVPTCDATDARLIDPVTDAQFTYSEGTLTRSGLVRAYLRLGEDPGSAEYVDFLQEIHVRNVP